MYTVGEIIVGAPKMQNYYGAIKLFILSNIVFLLLILFAKFLLLVLCFFYLEWMSDNNYCRNSWERDNYMGSNTEKNHTLMYKT